MSDRRTSQVRNTEDTAEDVVANQRQRKVMQSNTSSCNFDEDYEHFC